MYGKSVKADTYISRTYRIEAELGSGGSGAVYKAWHTRLRKHVVIKIVNNSSAGTIEVRRNEVEALKCIRNLYVPQVLDFLTEGDYSFSVMEYIDGESFDKLLRRGMKFTQAQILKWYSQLASALDAIHTHKVYHRDIKPSNIMLSTNDDVFLIDFNSALVSGNNTGVISRSMGYASPEQYEYFKICRDAFADSAKFYSYNIETVLIENDCITERISLANKTGYQNTNTPFIANAFSSGRTPGSPAPQYLSSSAINWDLSDIYSLGATMYHFLTKKRPPVKADEIARIPYLEGYSRGLLKIIEKSMKQYPQDRYQTAAKLGLAVKRVT